MMVVDLRLPKKRFATLIDDIPDTVVSQFIVWLDEKVSEFKVNGAMSLELSDTAPKWIQDYSMSVMLSGVSDNAPSTENSPGRYTSLLDRLQTDAHLSLKSKHHTYDSHNNSTSQTTISSQTSHLSSLATNSTPACVKRKHALPYNNSQRAKKSYGTRLNSFDNEQRKSKRTNSSFGSDCWAKRNPVLSRLNSSSNNFDVRKSQSSTSEMNICTDAAFDVSDTCHIKTELEDTGERSGQCHAISENNRDNSDGTHLSAESELSLNDRVSGVISTSVNSDHSSPNLSNAIISDMTTTSDNVDKVLLCMVSNGVVISDPLSTTNMPLSKTSLVRTDRDTLLSPIQNHTDSDASLSSIQNQTSFKMRIDEDDILPSTDVSQDSIVLSDSESECADDIQNYDLVPYESVASTDRRLTADDSPTYETLELDVWNSGAVSRKSQLSVTDLLHHINTSALVPTQFTDVSRNSALSHAQSMLQENSYQFQCMYCAQEVTGVSSFRKHLYDAHLDRNLESYSCIICGSVVNSIRMFVRHCVSHYKIHQCPKCNKSFTRSYVLRKHVCFSN